MNDTPRVLGGRYEVGAVLGRGGMAEVHVARDTRLGRTVAVKLLRPDLARDPSFQARFRREAQSAAALNHPSIVAVYDTGEDVHPEPGGGQVVLPYIVMEYVEGRTLRDLLRSGQPLSLEEALTITEGVLGALEYSHRMGIVHRDIKPANVMVTPSGEIKVMDFGIARAVSDSSATLTQTSAVMGTAQYLSPEQARGEQVDARSDVYSTGCLLYELLTGRPPFTGEAPVAVAYQHVSEQPKPPSSLTPHIPPAVDQVVLMALSKDRTHRYQSAADFADDLRRAVEGRPLRGATIAGAGATATAATTRLLGAVPPGAAAAGATTALPRPEPAGPPTGAVPAQDDDLLPEQRRRWPWVLLALLLAGAAAVAFYVLADPGGGGDGQTPTTTTPAVVQVAVPTVAGQDRAAAEAALREAGFEVRVTERADDDVEAGDVVGTTPEGGATAPRGSAVELVVSTGPDAVAVPELSGRTQEEAIAALEAAGLRVRGTETTDSSPRAERNTVVGSDPGEGERVARGTGVTLLVASGQVEVPEVVGQPQEQARDALNELGLQVNVTTVEADDEEAGTVLAQSEEPGSRVSTGTQITLEVAAEPEPSPSPTSSSPTSSPSPSSSSPSSSASPTSTGAAGGGGGNGGGDGGGDGGGGGNGNRTGALKPLEPGQRIPAPPED